VRPKSKKEVANCRTTSFYSKKQSKKTMPGKNRRAEGFLQEAQVNNGKGATGNCPPTLTSTLTCLFIPRPGKR
jgi:hypothetical protein